MIALVVAVAPLAATVGGSAQIAEDPRIRAYAIPVFRPVVDDGDVAAPVAADGVPIANDRFPDPAPIVKSPPYALPGRGPGGDTSRSCS